MTLQTLDSSRASERARVRIPGRDVVNAGSRKSNDGQAGDPGGEAKTGATARTRLGDVSPGISEVSRRTDGGFAAANTAALLLSTVVMPAFAMEMVCCSIAPWMATRLVAHLVELVYADAPSVRQHHRAAREHELSVTVLDDGRGETRGRGTLAGGVHAHGRRLVHELEKLRLGGGRIAMGAR